jgi:hypothetical protein
MKFKMSLLGLLTFGAMNLSGPSEMQSSFLLEKPQAMAIKQERELEREFTRSWSQRRGIETLNRNNSLLLVKVPLDQLSDALEKSAVEIRRDVLHSEVELSGHFIFTYQLVDHPWSIVVPDHIENCRLHCLLMHSFQKN